MKTIQELETENAQLRSLVEAQSKVIDAVKAMLPAFAPVPMPYPVPVPFPSVPAWPWEPLYPTCVPHWQIDPRGVTICSGTIGVGGGTWQ